MKPKLFPLSILRMNQFIRREQLQNFDPKPFLRTKAIDQTVDFISSLILKAASGTVPRYHEHWKIISTNKIMIEKILLSNTYYIRNPYTEGSEYFPDILPDVIKKLQTSFPDVDFRQDELGSYLIVDWS